LISGIITAGSITVVGKDESRSLFQNKSSG
jgi:hypothetical protein